MGANKKASLLPAPTESESTNGATEFESRLTDKTSYSLPEDGSPITIATRQRRLTKDAPGTNLKKSHTSLLIEYFEGSSSSPNHSRRPSVRVKVRPSSKIRNKASTDHIKISERNATRISSQTKRAKISSNTKVEKPFDADGDIHSNDSYHSTTEDSNVTFRDSGQIEVEITPRRHGSPLIPSHKQAARSLVFDPSELSSVPHDSFLDGNTQSFDYNKRYRSTTTEKTRATATTTELDSATGVDQLQIPQRSRSRSLSRERIVVQKAVEKVRSENSIQRRRKQSSRSRSVSSELCDAVKPLKKSNRSHNFDVMASGADTSLLNSHLSAKSGEAYSYRSGTSRSSINNPKLLETVEDAIRRLILPELNALKREQSKHIHRDRRSSFTSTSIHSKESRDSGFSRKKSEISHGIDNTGRPEVRLNDSEILSGDTVKSPVGEKHNYQSTIDSAVAREHEAVTETTVQDSERLIEKNSYDKQQNLGFDVATDAVKDSNVITTQSPSVSPNQNNKEHRKSDSFLYSTNDNSLNIGQRISLLNPPMPLMNDNNSSEITRSSILSAKSEILEGSFPLREMSHGASSPFPNISNKSPVGFQRGLGTQHSNMSRGDVGMETIDSESWQRYTEYELDEHGRKIIRGVLYTGQEANINKSPSRVPNCCDENFVDESLGTHNRDQDREPTQGRAQYFYQDIQEVPPPLRYVPYSQQRRGLSPIQSVSGLTEGESENLRESRLSHSTGSYSSIGRMAMCRKSVMSKKSYGSTGSHENPYDFPKVRKGGLADSEITQDSDDLEEQDLDFNQHGIIEQSGLAGDGSHANNKISTDLTSNILENPNFNTSNTSIKSRNEFNNHAADVQSAVASIVNTSDLTGLSGIHHQLDNRGFHSSADDELENILTVKPCFKGGSHGFTKDEGVTGAGRSSSHNSLVICDKEHDIDDDKSKYEKLENKKSLAALNGPKSEKTTSILEKRMGNPMNEQSHYDDNQENTRVIQCRSFHEREIEAPNQYQLPHERIEGNFCHEEYQMGASGIPDLNDPMPEIGFGDRSSDTLTKLSVNHTSSNEEQHQVRERWSVLSSQKSYLKRDTTQKSHSDSGKEMTEDSRNLDVSSSGGVRLNKGLDNEKLEEWRRDSSERKRDTLVTNPYENHSPVAHDALDSEIPDFHRFQRRLSYPARGLKLCREEGCNMPSASNSGSSQDNSPQTAPEHADVTTNVACDPFYTPKHQRSLSGFSQGMCSPLYDSATGNGIDRIESRDIIALMDHLTVRDAQRSARDTEILVTLVRAAAEMRNSFEDMKRLLADTEDVIITEVQANTDRSVRKVVQGPRPPPQPGRRSLRQGSYFEIYDDIPTKKTNVFRRALKGLSLKSANDLGKIEEMLVQLLGEVEGLKVAQGLKPISNHTGLYEQFKRGGHDHDEYENECNPSVSSHGHSGSQGHGVVDLSRNASHLRVFEHRKFSDHRISTVPEDDEQRVDSDTQTIFHNVEENIDNRSTPVKENARQLSMHTPSSPITGEGNALGIQGMQVSTATLKCKKQKSGGSSGWIPKVSRWSETTASNVLRGFRSNGRNGGRKSGEEISPGRWGSDHELGNSSENDPSGISKCSSLHSHERRGNFETMERAMSPASVDDGRYKGCRIKKAPNT